MHTATRTTTRTFPGTTALRMAAMALALVSAGALAQSRAATAPAVQAGPALSDQLHANAVASFRQGRFSEAYGRVVALADAGHAPSAELALWMYQNGPALFGKDWDSSQEQLTAWAHTAGRPAPVMVARAYPSTPLRPVSR